MEMLPMKENGKLSVIASICTLVFIIPTIASLIAGIIRQDLLSIIVSSIMIGVLLIIFCAILIQAFSKKHKSIIYRWLKYITTHKENTLLIERNSYYEFKDREHILHKKKFIVYGRNDFDSFTDRYVYSGDQCCKLNAPLSSQRIIDENKRLGWSFYTIKSDTRVKKGDSETFEMAMDEIYDSNHSSMLYLSTGIYEQTKCLKMCVKFGNSVTPRNAKIKVYADYTSLTPLEKRELIFDTNSRCLNYDLKYPVSHYKYEITWDF